jgi:hypothetical protein
VQQATMVNLYLLQQGKGGEYVFPWGSNNSYLC